KNAADAVFWAGKASHRVGKAERNPSVALFAVLLFVQGIAKLPCRNTDDREWPSIQMNRAADDVWRAGELPLPEGIAEHDHRIAAAEGILLFLKDTGKGHGNAEQSEVVRSAVGHRDAHRRRAIGNGKRASDLVTGQGVEGAVLLDDVAIERIGKLAASLRKARIGLREIKETTGVGILHRPQKNTFCYTEKQRI